MNILKQIKDLIHEYPNDQMLGSKVRHKYRDKEIYEDVINNGGNCILTNRDHKTGTDRIHEGFEKLYLFH